MVIYLNSNVNILIFWDTDFWLSLAVSFNHKKKKKFEVFYFRRNELHVIEKKFHHILIILDVPVYS